MAWFLLAALRGGSCRHRDVRVQGLLFRLPLVGPGEGTEHFGASFLVYKMAIVCALRGFCEGEVKSMPSEALCHPTAFHI